MKKINKKESRNELRRITEKAVIRDEQNSRIAFAAESPVGAVLEGLNTALTGLSEDEVADSRSLYGSNRVTKEKKKCTPKPKSEEVFCTQNRSGTIRFYFNVIYR